MPRENGYSTQKREVILDYLRENSDRAVVITDIVTHLADKKLEVNLSTIYRYLDKLIKSGQVIKTVHSRKEQAEYQYIGGHSECHNHLHIKCEKCGMIMHLDCSFMSQIAEHIMLEHGFLLNCEESYLTGICSECSNKDVDGLEEVSKMPHVHKAKGCCCGD